MKQPHRKCKLPDSWQLPLQEKVVCLVVKSPLTNGQGGSGLFDLGDHLVKLLGLVLPQVPVVFNAGHIQLMLGLRLWGLKRTGEDGNLDIAKLLLIKKLLFFIR
jgi:hypothetical protein